MNPHLVRALAEQRRVELTRAARRPERPAALGLRRRVGMVLVEVGLHLIARAPEPRPAPPARARVSSPLAR